MFDIIEKTSQWIVLCHKKTKVMYLAPYRVDYDSYGLCQGSTITSAFTVLLNPDGTPMIWEGD